MTHDPFRHLLIHSRNFAEHLIDASVMISTGYTSVNQTPSVSSVTSKRNGETLKMSNCTKYDQNCAPQDDGADGESTSKTADNTCKDSLEMAFRLSYLKR